MAGNAKRRRARCGGLIKSARPCWRQIPMNSNSSRSLNILLFTSFISYDISNAIVIKRPPPWATGDGKMGT